MTRRETIEHLARQLHRLGSSPCRRTWPAQQAHGSGVSTGVEALDRLFPRGGLCGGTLVECLVEGAGSGAGTLAVVLARRFLAGTRYSVPGTQHSVPGPPSGSRPWTLDSRPVVVIDPQGEFYPPGAVGLGLDLEQTIVVWPGNSREALWALEQSLRCPGVAVTLAWLDRLHKLGSQSFRRLALAAETGGGLGLLLRPAACRREVSWAHVRLLVQPTPPVEPGRSPKKGSDPFTLGLRNSTSSDRGSDPFFGPRRLHIHLLRGRKGHVAESLELELRDEPPDPVHLVAPLADSASAVRATGS